MERKSNGVSPCRFVPYQQRPPTPKKKHLKKTKLNIHKTFCVKQPSFADNFMTRWSNDLLSWSVERIYVTVVLPDPQEDCAFHGLSDIKGLHWRDRLQGNVYILFVKHKHDDKEDVQSSVPEGEVQVCCLDGQMLH